MCRPPRLPVGGTGQIRAPRSSKSPSRNRKSHLEAQTTMSDETGQPLQTHLERLAAALPGLNGADVHAAPNRQLFEQIIECLATDFELLQQFGFFTLDQSCAKICDVLEQKQLDRIKTFTHCGQEHSFHALQLYVTCPVCRKFRMKTRRLLGEDDIREVISTALLWLQIDPRTIPGGTALATTSHSATSGCEEWASRGAQEICACASHRLGSLPGSVL